MKNIDRFDINNYEYNINSRKGVYIIHGFSSTTYEVRELAKYLGKKGFHTKANNLPGHATNVEDCNNTKYQEWLEFVEKDFAEMIGDNDEVFIVGMSMGGALALHLASLFPVKRVVVCATVLYFADQKKLQWLNPITKYFYKCVPKIKRYDKKIRDNMIFHGYFHYPLVALNEFFKMAKIIKKRLNKISAPLLILFSERDLTSLKINVDIIYNGVKSKEKLIKGYSNVSHAMLTKSEDQKLIFNDIYKFLNNK